MATLLQYASAHNERLSISPHSFIVRLVLWLTSTGEPVHSLFWLVPLSDSSLFVLYSHRSFFIITRTILFAVLIIPTAWRCTDEIFLYQLLTFGLLVKSESIYLFAQD